MPFELDILSSISDNFLAYGLSAVDVSSGVVKGRPYGGTASLRSSTAKSLLMSLVLLIPMNLVYVQPGLLLVLVQF